MEKKTWMQTVQGRSHEYNKMMGDYLLDFELQLFTDNEFVTAGGEPTVQLGKAEMHVTDIAWLDDDSENLIERIHDDFNYEMNWNQPTNYEYLEDALKCVGYDKDGLKGKIAVLHKMSIEKEYRGRGYFTEFMNSIINYTKKLSCDYLILQACPFGDSIGRGKERDAEIQRLQRKYQQLGFVIYPLEKGVPYLFMSLSSDSLKSERYKKVYQAI